MTRAALLGVFAAVLTASVTAQEPGFSGTWTLEPARSRISEAAGLAALIGAGGPPTLHITQPANGTLIVESQINEGHARFYRPGAMIVTPVTVGPGGRITMTSRWEGRTLVSEGTRESSSGASSIVRQVRERLALDPAGRTLTIEVTTSGPDGTAASTLVYTRTRDVGPCQSWPTPCKTWPSR